MSEFNEWAQKLDQEIFFLKSSSINWLKRIEDYESETSKIHKASSKSSRSSRSSKHSSRSSSSHSSSRSSRSKMVEEETELAALQVRREFAEKKGAIEQMSYLDEEIAVRRAKIEVLRNHLTPKIPSEKGSFKSKTATSLSETQILNKNENVLSWQVPNDISEIPVSTAPFYTSRSVNLAYSDISQHLSTPISTSFIFTPVSEYVSTYTSESNPYSAYVSKPIASTYVTHSTPHVNVSVCQSKSDKVNVDRDVNDRVTMETLCDLFHLQNAPDIDLEMFNGDPLEFNFFMTSFEEVVEKRVRDSVGRLQRLIKYTSGDAKEMIKGCVYDNKNGYDQAKRLLKFRYGDPHRVLSAYSKELKEWKNIKSGDSIALRKFCNFLTKCNCVIKGNYWNTLDSIDNLCTILSKLPGNTRDKWNRKALSIRTNYLREPELQDMITFVSEELTLWSDPLFSKEALEQRKLLGTDPGKGPPSNKPFKSFYSGQNVYCQLCNKTHDIEGCPLFKGKPIKDKINILMRSRLCFGCYMKGHVLSFCKNVRTCKVCKKDHPTALHGYVPKTKSSSSNTSSTSSSTTSSVTASIATTNQSTVSTCTVSPVPITSALISNRSSNAAFSMSVVPVILKHPSTSREVRTYALLDPCSEGSFIDEKLLKELNSDYISTEITVKTLNGISSQISKRVDGMLVKNIFSDDWLNLSTLFSREYLDIDGEGIPDENTLKEWPYLSEIRDLVDQSSERTVGILIGSNCPRLIEPLKVIPSQNNGPYAIETRLGWCVVGPINNESSILYCNKKGYPLGARWSAFDTRQYQMDNIFGSGIIAPGNEYFLSVNFIRIPIWGSGSNNI